MDTFDFSNFTMIWGNYVDIFCEKIDKQEPQLSGVDIRSKQYRQKISQYVAEDLRKNGFSEDEIIELTKMEGDGIPVVSKDAWTHFVAYRIKAIEDFRFYDEMCDLLDKQFDTKFERTAMPTTADDEDNRDETLALIFKWSQKI